MRPYPFYRFALALRLSFFAAALYLCVFCVAARSSDNPAKNMGELLLPYRYPVKKQVIRVGGETLDIAYIDQGNSTDKREIIVFTHGLASYLPVWDKTIAGLSKRYRCIALDLPGYGRSASSARASVQFYADVVAAFVRALKLRAVNLAGHSMGGQIAIALALKQPRLIKRLILIAPTGVETFTEAQRKFIGARVTDNYSRRKDETVIKNDFERVFFQFPADAAFMVQDRVAIRAASDFGDHCSVLTRCVRAVINEPVLAKLSAIRHPALIIFGAEDNIIPNALFNPMLTTQDVGMLAQQKIKRGKLLILPDCGHFAQFDKPGEINRAIEEFIRSNTTR